MSSVDPTKTHLDKDFKHDSPLISCRFEPGGRFVFAGAQDCTVRRWDLDSGAMVTLDGHESWVHALAGTPDGHIFLTGGCDGRLVWWPTIDEKPAPIRTVDAHRGWVRSIAVSPDGQLAATGGNDKMVRLWSVADGQLVQELPGHGQHVYRVGFDPSGKSLVSADLHGVVIHWDLAIRKQARRLDAGKLFKYNPGQGVDYGGVRDLCFSPDGSTLACSGLIDASNPLGAVSIPAVLLFDWATGKETRLQRPKEDVRGVAWGVRYHESGFIVFVSGGNVGGYLWFAKPDQVNEFSKLKLPNTARDLDMHPDGIRLATAHFDGHLRTWSMTPKA